MTMAALAMPTDRPMRKEREADIAWAQHRRERMDRIPVAAKRAARIWRRSLQPSAEAMAKALDSEDRWRPLVYGAFFRTRRGRAMGLAGLRSLFHSAVVERVDLGEIGNGCITIWWLEPRESLVEIKDPSFTQDAVVVHAFSALRQQKRLSCAPLAAVEAPDHCVGRMIERGAGVDVSSALHEAGRAFMALPFDLVADTAFSGKTLILPAGCGVMLCNVIFGHGPESGLWRVFARARTFVSADLAHADQHPPPPASSPELSVLAAGLNLLGSVRGVPSPLTEEQRAALASYRPPADVEDDEE